MSTFKGVIDEFPEIRVDYFRIISGRSPPLACFLSHVHSDHLLGLESLKAPFVYCSPATRELLLCIEKYPHRVNLAKGILEWRKQHYRHLRSLLRPIPLDAPTEIELCPNKFIRVTLLDANHCPGAVMFLIEGDGKAVLYTGDIRSEPWWIDALVRHPVLLPYTCGNRHLTKIYLDTTFVAARQRHANFPSKSEGLRELLEKVLDYPKDTIFHLHAWTLGYEEVWLALASTLDTRARLYSALSHTLHGALDRNAAALNGFECGNQYQRGALTEEGGTRVHSCEKGLDCVDLNQGSSLKSPRVVWIRPMLTRTSSGAVVPEMGAGGGVTDLRQAYELDLKDPSSVTKLMQLCSDHVPEQAARSSAMKVIMKAAASASKVIDLRDLGIAELCESLPIHQLPHLLASSEMKANQARIEAHSTDPKAPCQVISSSKQISLPNCIYFPYSRHSSFEELRMLVAALHPADVYPCTVDKAIWTPDTSIEKLFGDLCSGDRFAHDEEMHKEYGDQKGRSSWEKQLMIEDTSSDSDAGISLSSYTHREPAFHQRSPKMVEHDVDSRQKVPTGSTYLTSSFSVDNPSRSSTSISVSAEALARSKNQRDMQNMTALSATRTNAAKSALKTKLYNTTQLSSCGQYASSPTTGSSPSAALYSTVPQNPLNDDEEEVFEGTPDDDTEYNNDELDSAEHTVSTSAFVSWANESPSHMHVAKHAKRRRYLYQAIGVIISQGEGVDLDLITTAGHGGEEEDVEI